MAMRPRKVVLCAGSNPDRLGERAFLLKIWGYTVITAATAIEALASLESLLPGQLDLLCLDLPLDNLTPEILEQARRVCPELRTLITSNHESAYYRAYCADVLLIRGSTAELIERVRILVARKRGPKKKPVARALPPFGSKSKRRAA
jgi:two-component system response regulator CpxR